ncbi:MAG: hypothetical protein AAFQ84_00360, partial [Pseudomonadota bacterium]
MSSSSAMPEIDALRAILEEEVALLDAGQILSAVALSGQKTKAVEALERALSSLPDGTNGTELAEGLAAINALATEAGVLFRAVGNGLARAIDRLQSIGQLADVGSYTGKGERLKFSN